MLETNPKISKADMAKELGAVIATFKHKIKNTKYIICRKW